MANEAKPCPCDIGDRFDHEGCGQEVQVGHIKAYVCKPSVKSDKAVIVIHDIFGWRLPNTRYMADLLTTHGYVAICPDFFVGQEPWKPSNDWASFNDWLKTRDSSKIDKEMDVVLKYLQEQCGAKKIGVIGFCWGGAAVHHVMLKNPHLKAGVSNYGVIRFFEDGYNLLHPTFFIFAEKDDYIPLEQVIIKEISMGMLGSKGREEIEKADYAQRRPKWKYALIDCFLLIDCYCSSFELKVTQLEQKLKEKCKVDYEVKIYPGQTHGFVHRKREDINPQDKPYIEEGRRDMLNWLNKYI